MTLKQMQTLRKYHTEIMTLRRLQLEVEDQLFFELGVIYSSNNSKINTAVLNNFQTR
jgi:hypothetical protein